MRADIERRLRALELDARARAATTDALSRIDVTQHEAPIYRAVHDAIEAREYRYINLPGGRGSAKSSFAALELVNGVMADPTGNTSAIAFRRYASTMRESIFSTLAWAIDVLDVGDLWRATLAPMGFTYLPTGAVILCRGLDDASKLKSIKPLKGVFRLGWFEEFSELPGENFTRNVMQSIMRGGEGFTAIRTFNPPNSRAGWSSCTDWVKRPGYGRMAGIRSPGWKKKIGRPGIRNCRQSRPPRRKQRQKPLRLVPSRRRPSWRRCPVTRRRP